MIRLAHLRQTLLATLILALPCLAQLADQGGNPTPQASDAKTPPDQQRAALSMLDQVLAGMKNLSVPENRIAIGAEAFPVLCGLIPAGDFLQPHSAGNIQFRHCAQVHKEHAPALSIHIHWAQKDSATALQLS